MIAVRSLAITLTLTVAIIFGDKVARSQSPAAQQALMGDLCGCMTRVDLRATDGVFERSVRTCLENAVLHHPSSARELLKDGPEKGTAGYRLGQVLGAHLDRQCEAFRAVKVRLQHVHEKALLKKGSS
ncbi:MAG: hypothetical protein IPG10_19390 [Flavobacteriales bacterium]|nr:hypothetical protein [Flavobacteriales bacterium]MBK6755434.1 hypothetical protein [Flavobacteriales bacterium]MBK7086580.1 hypothetical protein [Flavobacteriales bacterium]MBK7269289.1 hypothetical protein [Flavobacteriales bacterium]MBK7753913.1 hypothetical protein [Flavobacteriales bacterium]